MHTNATTITEQQLAVRYHKIAIGRRPAAATSITGKNEQKNEAERQLNGAYTKNAKQKKQKIFAQSSGGGGDDGSSNYLSRDEDHMDMVDTDRHIARAKQKCKMLCARQPHGSHDSAARKVDKKGIHSWLVAS